MFNKLPNLVRPSLITYCLLGGCLTLISMKPTQAETRATQTLAQVEYAQNEFDFNSQYNPNSESYLVIVDNTNPNLLQQVRRIEPTAFAGDFLGRSVIQAGFFRSLTNAQERTRE
ncbi:MAG: hypothetical protein AAGG00_08045, partial [Cyanobacteria bacterium P01_H01_bin.150]